MLFKNMIVYRLKDGAPTSVGSELHLHLDDFRAQPITNLDLERSGFVSPFDHDPAGLLARTVDGRSLICLQTEQKIIPGSVVRDAVQARVAHIEQRDARKVYKKERDQLKDEVLLDLLPRAFVRKSFLYALVCPKDRLIIINTTSHAKAEDLLSRLREALGSLPALPFSVLGDVSSILTGWVKDSASNPPPAFAVGRACQLYSQLDTSSVIRCKNVDLDSDEVNEHLQAGMLVSHLAIGWRDELDCTITSDLTFRGISFADVLVEAAHDLDTDDREAVRDSELAMMAGTLVKFLESVTVTLGGEPVHHDQCQPKFQTNLDSFPRQPQGDAHLHRFAQGPGGQMMPVPHGVDESGCYTGQPEGDAHLQVDAFGGAA